MSFQLTRVAAESDIQLVAAKKASAWDAVRQHQERVPSNLVWCRRSPSINTRFNCIAWESTASEQVHESNLRVLKFAVGVQNRRGFAARIQRMVKVRGNDVRFHPQFADSVGLVDVEQMMRGLLTYASVVTAE